MSKLPRTRVAGPLAPPRPSVDLEALLKNATSAALPALTRAATEPERRIRLEVDLTNHAVAVRVREGEVARSEPLGASARAHFDATGQLIGLSALTPEELAQVVVALARFDRWRVTELRALDRTLRKLPGLLA